MSKTKILKLGRVEWEVLDEIDCPYYCAMIDGIKVEIIGDSKVYIQTKSSAYSVKDLKCLTKAINQAKKLLAHLKEQLDETKKV